MLSLLKYELFSRWGAVLGWGLGLSFFAALYIAIYPEIADKIAVLAEISFYQAMGIDMSSFEGIIASSVIQNFVVMLAIYVIVSSSGTLAGEEDRGTLELIVTMPLKRWQIVTTKAAALLVATFLILLSAGVSSMIALTWMKNFVEVDVTAMQMLAAVLSCWPVTIALLMIGIFFSACFPDRRTASIATTAVLLVSYLGEMVAMNVDSLNGIRPFLLFHYFDASAAVFLEGVQASDVGILLGVAFVFYILALVSFQRRDITVGQWPWQRAVARRTLRQAIAGGDEA